MSFSFSSAWLMAGLSSGLLLLSCSAPAQHPGAAPAAHPIVGPDSTVLVAAGSQYDRGSIHRFFWGTHYRDLWKLPVRVPVFNLRTAVPGGLTPIKEGGSFQTKNLRLVDQSGREYVLRSVDKDATRALPEGLREGPVGRIMKDQTSVIHPYGAYVAAPLARAAGLYHTNPRLVYVADDPALGEFREGFGYALYLFEERPDGDQTPVTSFGNSARVESSRKVFTNLLASSRFQVDARQYLRNRLFDMFLGDWSRREDQWRWASFPAAAGGTTYQAIPRDRDHAFFKFDDGLLTHMIGWVKTNYQSFHEKIRLADVEGLNRAAQPMDKSLLPYLTRDEFRQVADSLRGALSDEVIARALAVWPPEVRELSQAEFTRKLRARRDQLPAVAEKFYELLARDVELPGTDEAERFIVEPAGPDAVRVQLLRRTPQGDTLLHQRTFSAAETRSIKLFGLGGDDAFELRGEPTGRIRLSIYDGSGQDLMEATPPPTKRPGSRLTIYESGDGNTLRVGKFETKAYQPQAQEFDAAGWLLRHRLY
ncbi:hypothetical protein [Hymenobacter psychrophilus]|nr:hypothetical protein [Hymenobacter psychrophilus]